MASILLSPQQKFLTIFAFKGCGTPRGGKQAVRRRHCTNFVLVHCRGGASTAVKREWSDDGARKGSSWNFFLAVTKCQTSTFACIGPRIKILGKAQQRPEEERGDGQQSDQVVKRAGIGGAEEQNERRYFSVSRKSCNQTCHFLRKVRSDPGFRAATRYR